MLDLNEQISEQHKTMFQRMLGIKGDLPEFLLAEYFKVKKLVDKIDGHIGPCSLAEMALRCGFNTEYMRFETFETKTFTGGIPAGVTKTASADVTIEEQAAADAVVDAPMPILENGTPVEIIVNDLLVEGMISGTQEKDGKRSYQVDTDDGETLTVDKNDVDVVE